ncbi:MAG: hypothetical protein ACD_34C00148G0001, partial [uncultured bacterium]
MQAFVHYIQVVAVQTVGDERINAQRLGGNHRGLSSKHGIHGAGDKPDDVVIIKGV